MAALIWMALVAAWIWHVVDLFCAVDPRELPPRARHWAGDAEPDEYHRTGGYARLEDLNANL